MGRCEHVRPVNTRRRCRTIAMLAKRARSLVTNPATCQVSYHWSRLSVLELLRADNPEFQDAAAARKASRSVGAASGWLNGIGAFFDVWTGNLPSFLLVLWAALAVFSTAYSVAIIGSTLGQTTFAIRFGFATNPKINDLISAAVGGGQAAGFCGQFVASWCSDKYGRRKTIAIFCCM